jgi:hypothetical protein
MSWKRSDAGPCECDWFEQAAAEPNVPVQFDETVGAYDLVYDGPEGPHRLRLYFCPFCGGSAPTSRREEMFARLTDTELHRLRELTDDLKTIEDVIGRFGPPDEDHPVGDGERSPADLARHRSNSAFARLFTTGSPTPFRYASMNGTTARLVSRSPASS